MKKKLQVAITVETIPHPNPKEAIDLIARLVVDELINQEKAKKVS